VAIIFPVVFLHGINWLVFIFVDPVLILYQLKIKFVNNT
jgi:hypothetical protein